MDASDPLVIRSQARVGQWVREKWRLDRLLGVGGMAAVYAATHRNGARAAVKMLHREFSLDREIQQRFLREGYLSNAVEHPGVVRALDDDTADDGSVFLVLELLDGESLEARWLRHGQRLDVHEVLYALDPVLSVLHAAHGKGIVHRDLKPDNLFLTRDGSLKLLDFGIARLRADTARRTQTGMTLGTPAFMAPEQALGRDDAVGPWTDLWSLGATLFTLVSGHLVHRADTPNAMLVAAATQHAPSLSLAMPGAPAPLVQLVDRALRYAPAERWASAEDMQLALRETYHALAGSPVQTAPLLRVPSIPDIEPPAADTGGSRTLAHEPRSGMSVSASSGASSARLPNLADDDEEKDKTSILAPEQMAALAARQKAEGSQLSAALDALASSGASRRASFLSGPGSSPAPSEMSAPPRVSSPEIARTKPMSPRLDPLVQPPPSMAMSSGYSSGSTVPWSPAPVPSRRGPLVAGVGAVLALVLIGTVWIASRTTSSDEPTVSPAASVSVSASSTPVLAPPSASVVASAPMVIDASALPQAPPEAPPEQAPVKPPERTPTKSLGKTPVTTPGSKKPSGGRTPRR